MPAQSLYTAVIFINDFLNTKKSVSQKQYTSNKNLNTAAGSYLPCKDFLIVPRYFYTLEPAKRLKTASTALTETNGCRHLKSFNILLISFSAAAAISFPAAWINLL